jgi:hypothetical protein
MLERGVVVHLVYGQGSLNFVTPFIGLKSGREEDDLFAIEGLVP